MFLFDAASSFVVVDLAANWLPPVGRLALRLPLFPPTLLHHYLCHSSVSVSVLLLAALLSLFRPRPLSTARASLRAHGRSGRVASASPRIRCNQAQAAAAAALRCTPPARPATHTVMHMQLQAKWKMAMAQSIAGTTRTPRGSIQTALRHAASLFTRPSTRPTPHQMQRDGPSRRHR